VETDQEKKPTHLVVAKTGLFYQHEGPFALVEYYDNGVTMSDPVSFHKSVEEAYEALKKRRGYWNNKEKHTAKDTTA
jgi:hypothetical protein